MKLIAKDKEHLQEIIEQEIAKNGNTCSLNHVDVSKITDISGLFRDSKFTGHLSKWDVSNVTDMSFLFYKSSFDNDISYWNTSSLKNMNSLFAQPTFNKNIENWNVEKVTNMRCLFAHSKFTGDISKWDVSSVLNMNDLLFKSQVTTDLSVWKPKKLEEKAGAFEDCKSPIPYWGYLDSNSKIQKAIELYELASNLNLTLKTKPNIKRKKL